jgi:hypothetical protein
VPETFRGALERARALLDEADVILATHETSIVRELSGGFTEYQGPFDAKPGEVWVKGRTFFVFQRFSPEPFPQRSSRFQQLIRSGSLAVRRARGHAACSLGANESGDPS